MPHQKPTYNFSVHAPMQNVPVLCIFALWHRPCLRVWLLTPEWCIMQSILWSSLDCSTSLLILFHTYLMFWSRVRELFANMHSICSPLTFRVDVAFASCWGVKSCTSMIYVVVVSLTFKAWLWTVAKSCCHCCTKLRNRWGFWLMQQVNALLQHMILSQDTLWML